jgi:hypothetical protein
VGTFSLVVVDKQRMEEAVKRAKEALKDLDCGYFRIAALFLGV